MRKMEANPVKGFLLNNKLVTVVVKLLVAMMMVKVFLAGVAGKILPLVND